MQQSRISTSETLAQEETSLVAEGSERPQFKTDPRLATRLAKYVLIHLRPLCTPRSLVDQVGGAVRGLCTGPLCPAEAAFGVRAAVRGLCNAASQGVFFSERVLDFKTTPFRPKGD